MMGLHNWLHWTAWFLRYLLQLTFSVLVMTVLFSISLGDQGAVLKNSNPFLIFVYLELYAMASISLAFLLSTFFKKGICDHLFVVKGFILSNSGYNLKDGEQDKPETGCEFSGRPIVGDD